MYNIPIEVTEQQYSYLRRAYSSSLAYRTESDRYYIRIYHNIIEIKAYILFTCLCNELKINIL